MTTKQTKYKKRKPIKWGVKRDLSSGDITALDFLWSWKVATTSMLHEVAYKDKSIWWVYKAVRQLQSEGYIQSLPRSKHFNQQLWALTSNGFEIVLMDRDDIKMMRYRPHAPAHDFLATCLQLGDLWQSKKIVKQFLTEQMLASIAPSNFPREFRDCSEHVPDGATIVHGKLKQVTIAYEVDINLKAEERYESTFNYYHFGVEPEIIFWLVRTKWMANRIEALCKQKSMHSSNNNLPDKLAFILLDDFKKLVWGAPVISGSFKGHSVRKLHAKLLQSVGETPANLSQKPMQKIFFPKYKSPQKLIAYGGPV